MPTLAVHTEARTLIKPVPRTGPIAIRPAVLGGGDVKFIDDLQRKHSRMVGWFPTKQLETNITRGHVLIAEEHQDGGTGILPVRAPGSCTGRMPVPPVPCTGGTPVPPTPLGYCIAHDRYFKRDDCGIVYQLNVVPGKQRSLIGASLIKAVFERAAYGCKLFCCWCAQDLEANHFWESLGFVPLAFRTGSRKSGGAGAKKEPRPRIHIFWQRRIREGDTETPYWFPAETSGGAVRENRLVLPIPPGMHWSDAKPAILPGMENVNTLQIEAEAEKKPRVRKSKAVATGPKKPTGGLWFAPPKEHGQVSAGDSPGRDARATKVKKERAPRQKNDPKYIAAARELRDRYLEQFNTPGDRLLPAAHGKYDVSRQLDAAPSFPGALKQTPLLKAA